MNSLKKQVVKNESLQQEKKEIIKEKSVKQKPLSSSIQERIDKRLNKK